MLRRSRHSVVFALVALRVEHADRLIDHVLLAISQEHVTGLAGDEDLGNAAKCVVGLVCLLAGLESLHTVGLPGVVPADHVELTVARGHLLHIVLADGIAAGNL